MLFLSSSTDSVSLSQSDSVSLSRSDSASSTSSNKKKRGPKPKPLEIDLDIESPVVMKIHHFNISDRLSGEVENFVKVNLHCSAKDFKKNWEAWRVLPNIAELLNNEIEQMTKNGYNGDVMEKLYFSARYYYRKKALKEEQQKEEEEEKTPKQRRKYETNDREILDKMNQHILLYISSRVDKKTGKCDFKPAKAFEDYCINHASDIEDYNNIKLKKSYKNAFFVLRKKMCENGFAKPQDLSD